MLCIRWKGAFSAEKLTFSAHSGRLDYPWTLVLWNSSWATFSESTAHAPVCFRCHCAWAVAVTRGEKVPFQPLLKNIGEHWVFRKVTLPFHQCSRISFALHCKKRLAIFPSPAGMSLTKISLAGNNQIIPREQLNFSPPGRVWLVTSRLGTGNSITVFYSV